MNKPFLSRAATSSLTDLEMKLNKAIERNVILGKSSISLYYYMRISQPNCYY